MNPFFWDGKNVFLTGHTGFKGSWLSLWLQSLGANVTGYALKPPTFPNLFEVASVDKGMHSVIGDIRNLDNLKKAMKDANPEIIIHMAAQSLVHYSYTNPIETYDTNVMGTVHLFDAVRQLNNVKVVVNVTSDKCYDNKEKLSGYKEDDPMGGYDPYSSSKGCAELITKAYQLSFFNPDKYQEHGIAIASARAGNVIGGGDWSTDRLIPDFIRAIAKKENLVIRNPISIRPWQHVLEPLKGYLMLSQNLYNKGSEFAEAWNFGPKENEVKNVEWIVQELIKNWGEGASYQIDKNQNHFHEARYLNLDSSKAKNRLNWEPKWHTDEIITKICAWHKAHLNKQDMYKYSLNEINEYQL